MSEARQKVAVVTGGGGGIGAAVAEELGRGGWYVVTVDPLLTLDGSARLPQTEETTAGRITAAGGSARASAVSVADRSAVRELLHDLAGERGGVDAVVNVAGITRPTAFARGSAEDWLAVLSVHLGGYLNVLEAALPIMAAAGHGHILGVTSGSGWRSADAGAYSCAKRAVAALTWQLGRRVPHGVTVNAMSPIAETRMVAQALARARQASAAAGGGSSTGGLSLGSLPAPADLGPIGAYLAGDQFGWCNGRALFTGGSEVAFIDEPRLLEVVRTGGAVSLPRVLEAVVPGALAVAESAQATAGGGNPRFGPIFEEPASATASGTPVRSCAIVSDRPALSSRLGAALESRSVLCCAVGMGGGFGEAAKRLAAIADTHGPLDAVVLAPSCDAPGRAGDEGWEEILASHGGIVEGIHNDAGWARAAAEHASGKDRSLRLVTLTDGTTAGGRSRAQASAQLARAAATSTGGKIAAFAVSMEASEERAGPAAAELVAHLLTHPDPAGLAGAELVVDAEWLGLRSHPRPTGSVIYGGPGVPDWLDGALRKIAGMPS